jgi:aldehyde:ferredoxin oxidoreductase
MKAGIDPLGPENMLGFLPGLLNGTGTPMATKYVVVTKSPLSYTWGDANSGGLLSSELKAAGYDGIFFTGSASKPVYLLINDATIEIRSGPTSGGRTRVRRLKPWSMKQEINGCGSRASVPPGNRGP